MLADHFKPRLLCYKSRWVYVLFICLTTLLIVGYVVSAWLAVDTVPDNPIGNFMLRGIEFRVLRDIAFVCFFIIYLIQLVRSLLEYDPKWKSSNVLRRRKGRWKYLIPLIITTPLAAFLIWDAVATYHPSPYDEVRIIRDIGMLITVLIFSIALTSIAFSYDVPESDEREG